MFLTSLPSLLPPALTTTGMLLVLGWSQEIQSQEAGLTDRVQRDRGNLGAMVSCLKGSQGTAPQQVLPSGAPEAGASQAGEGERQGPGHLGRKPSVPFGV